MPGAAISVATALARWQGCIHRSFSSARHPVPCHTSASPPGRKDKLQQHDTIKYRQGSTQLHLKSRKQHRWVPSLETNGLLQRMQHVATKNQHAYLAAAKIPTAPLPRDKRNLLHEAHTTHKQNSIRVITATEAAPHTAGWHVPPASCT